ncbi:MAG: choice-of-anchor L domain-containing protein [Gemmatimonadaceae bacterium]|nr:choice-of-anchor L domain-containing protein [Gloeobacterales cyanobacterium ES-bin-141]
MKTRILPLSISVSAFLAFSALSAPLGAVEITTTSDATVLSNALVAPDSGITVVNSSYIGAANASGLFTAGGNIGIDSGVLLTSGSAVGAIGPNNSGSFTVANNTAGDAALSALAGGPTFDASSLLLDFTTNTGSISFSFVFASEEYQEFVGSAFNDVFAFFVNDQNIALIPGTTTPIAINTVNQNLNTQFYRSNLNSSINTQYDGLTTVLTVGLSGLSTTQVNSLRFAIADTADLILDSGVFIQGNVTSLPPTEIPEPSTLPVTLTLGGFLAAGVLLKRFRTHRA